MGEGGTLVFLSRPRTPPLTNVLQSRPSRTSTASRVSAPALAPRLVRRHRYHHPGQSRLHPRHPTLDCSHERAWSEDLGDGIEESTAGRLETGRNGLLKGASEWSPRLEEPRAKLELPSNVGGNLHRKQESTRSAHLEKLTTELFENDGRGVEELRGRPDGVGHGELRGADVGAGGKGMRLVGAARLLVIACNCSG